MDGDRDWARVEFLPSEGDPADSFTLDDLAHGGVVSADRLLMRVRRGGSGAGPLRFEQWVDGRLVATLEDGDEGREVAWPLRLARGRNVLRLEGIPGAPPEVELVHRTGCAETMEGLVKALIILVLVQTFVVQTYRIPSSSMEASLFPGDYVLVEKVSYVLRAPEPGEMVVFRYPRDFRKDFVKRVVARGGELVAVRDGYAVIDGRPLDERGYASCREWLPFAGAGRNRTFGPLVVPAGHLFVMGDNRDNSMDGRVWGPLRRSAVSGQPWMIYWPLARFGLVRHAGRRFAEAP